MAELLSADKQRVLASAVTPVRALPVRLPVALKLATASVDARLDAKTGAVLELKGAVERLNGFAGDASIALTGLPAGVPVPAALNVKAGETAFAFKLALPPTTPAGEVKLRVGVTATDPKQPNVRVKGRDAEATLRVLVAPK